MHRRLAQPCGQPLSSFEAVLHHCVGNLMVGESKLIKNGREMSTFLDYKDNIGISKLMSAKLMKRMSTWWINKCNS